MNIKETRRSENHVIKFVMSEMPVAVLAAFWAETRTGITLNMCVPKPSNPAFPPFLWAPANPFTEWYFSFSPPVCMDGCCFPRRTLSPKSFTSYWHGSQYWSNLEVMSKYLKFSLLMPNLWQWDGQLFSSLCPLCLHHAHLQTFPPPSYDDNGMPYFTFPFASLCCGKTSRKPPWWGQNPLRRHQDG